VRLMLNMEVDKVRESVAHGASRGLTFW